MEIPTKITTPEDKVKYLYRVLELSRLEHNEKGKDFRDGKITEKDWKSYVINVFRPRESKIFDLLNPIKDSLGMFQLDPKNESDPKTRLKDDGTKESKWDIDIDITKI